MYSSPRPRGRCRAKEPSTKGMLMRVLVSVMAMALVGGAFAGLFSTAVLAATSHITLTMTSGTVVIHGGSGTTLPTPSSITGTESSTTGNISGGTLTIPAWHEANTGSSETIHFYEPSPGSGSGTIASNGNTTYSDTLAVEVHITSPVTQQCVASPIHISFVSTSPYSSSTHSVVLRASPFTIPTFSSSNCSLAASSLDSTFSGSTNSMTLSLHGTLTLPSTASAATTTTLAVTPASPQLQGTAVGLTATVKKATGLLATAATGSVSFRDGSKTLGSASVSGGIASVSTNALTLGTDSLTAVYSGGGGYAGSTSAAVLYVIKAPPTVTVTGLPATVPGGQSTFHTFAVKVTNPSNGLTLTHLFLTMTLKGMRVAYFTTNVIFEYKDSVGTWCKPLDLAATGHTAAVGFVAGAQSSCTPTFPASFLLAAGSSYTVDFRVAYPTTSFGSTLYGAQTITASVSTGSCSSATACAAAPPLSGPSSPSGSESMTIVPSSPFETTSTRLGRTSQGTVHQTFDLGLVTEVKPTAAKTTPTTALPAPTGSISYLVDGTITAGSASITTKAGSIGDAPNHVFKVTPSTVGVGKHHVVATYHPLTHDGKTIYSSSSYSFTFTVTAAPSGTEFTCDLAGLLGGTATGYVTASGTVPATGVAGTEASVTGISVTLTADPTLMAGFYNENEGAELGFSPTGSPALAGKITFTGTTASSTASVGTWSGLSTSIPLTGTVVHVGANLIEFAAGLIGVGCTPTSNPAGAPIGTIHVTHHTPVTWTLSGCTSGSTTAPSWANTEEILAKGAGGGGGGAAAYAGPHAGAGGAGSSATAYLTIAGSTEVSAKSGCAGQGAPHGFIPGNGGAAASGWSSSGKGGQGYYCAGFFCTHDDGTGGSGGGSTGVCNGTTTCTSSSGTPVAVAAGGGGGGETMCSAATGGNGGQAGNASSTSANGGSGPSGSNGVIGGPGGTGSPGGAGGANNKSSGSGSATGSAGGTGTKTDILGDSAGAGGGGAGYIGGKGGTKSGLDADCDAAGGGGGGSSWVTSSDGAGGVSYGTGAAGGGRSGANGTAGSVEVIFSYTPAR
jgi:hypothetical protein